VRARSPREFVWNNYAESHTHTLIAIRLGPRPASTLQPTVEIHNRSRVLGHCRIARKAGGSMVGLDVPASDETRVSVTRPARRSLCHGEGGVCVDPAETAPPRPER
jgi:hypothetical protein